MPFDGNARPNEVSELILRAREEIRDPRRWCRGKARRGFFRRRYCVWGAVNIAAVDETTQWSTLVVAQNVMMRAARTWGYATIGQFNDDVWTDHGDALAFLEEAAAMAKGVNL